MTWAVIDEFRHSKTCKNRDHTTNHKSYHRAIHYQYQPLGLKKTDEPTNTSMARHTYPHIIANILLYSCNRLIQPRIRLLVMRLTCKCPSFIFSIPLILTCKLTFDDVEKRTRDVRVFTYTSGCPVLHPSHFLFTVFLFLTNFPLFNSFSLFSLQFSNRSTEDCKTKSAYCTKASFSTSLSLSIQIDQAYVPQKRRKKLSLKIPFDVKTRPTRN